MNPHPYLRAYLAGVFVTTLILPVMLTAFIVIRLVLQVPVPIERGLIFPMSLVPAVWGLWNMLWLASRERTHLAVGVHGAVLPFLLLPVGATFAHSYGILTLGATSVTWFNALLVPLRPHCRRILLWRRRLLPRLEVHRRLHQPHARHCLIKGGAPCS